VETVVAAPVAEVPLEPRTMAEIVATRRAMRRAAFQAERQAFLDRHPGLREAIAAGPDARKAYLAQHPAVRAEVRTRIAEAQARKAAQRAAMIQRQRARLDDPVAAAGLRPIDPAMRAAMLERRAARRAEWDTLDPAARAALIEAFRARRDERRAMRLERRRAQGNTSAPMAGEGSAPPPR
jgi:hypothetical protein